MVLVNTGDAWETRPTGDLITGAKVEGMEVEEKYLDCHTDINRTVEHRLIAAVEELIAALWAVWYLAARALSLTCLSEIFFFWGHAGCDNVAGEGGDSPLKN